MLQVPQHKHILIVKILKWSCGGLKTGFLQFLQMNNFTTEHDTTKLIRSFHSQSIIHSNDSNISYCEKIAQIDENPLIIDLVFCQNFAIFAMCLKHQTIHISRLAVLS